MEIPTQKSVGFVAKNNPSTFHLLLILNFLQVLPATMELLPLPPWVPEWGLAMELRLLPPWVLERGLPMELLPPHPHITATLLQLGDHHHQQVRGALMGAHLLAPHQE